MCFPYAQVASEDRLSNSSPERNLNTISNISLPFFHSKQKRLNTLFKRLLLRLNPPANEEFN